MHPDLLRGALYILVSELLLVSMSAVVKHVSGELPNEMLVFCRNLAGLLVLLPLVARRGLGELKTSVAHLHLARGLIGVSAMYCYFYSLAHLPLAEATIYKLTAPLFLPLIGWLWLKERVPRLAVLAVLVGFAGVALILRPGFGGLSTAALVGLTGALLAADAKVTVRRLGRSEPSTRIVFYFGVVATSASAVPLLWAWQTPSATALGWLALLGVLATGAQLLLTRAYALAPAGQIGPFTYVAVVYGTLYGWWFWGETLAALTVAGMGLVVLAGLMTMQSGRRSRPGEVPRAAAGPSENSTSTNRWLPR